MAEHKMITEDINTKQKDEKNVNQLLLNTFCN